MSTDWFEDVEDKTHARPKEPIWAMDLDDEANDKKVLEWLNGELEYLKHVNRDRFEKIKRNIARYKGMQYNDQNTRETRTELRDRLDQRNRLYTRMVVNQAFDLTKMQTSRLIKYKPAVAILPTNDEFGDKIAAKMCKSLLDHIWYNEQFEGKLAPDWIRSAKVCGEAYVFVDWDPDKGDLHPDSKRLQGQKIPLLDELGNQETDQQGNPKFIERPVRVGDVAYELELPMNCLFHRHPQSPTWEKCEYVFRRKVMHVEEVRALYPDKASEIKAERDISEYNFETFELESLANHVCVWEFSHKRTRNLDKGRRIVFTKNSLLSNKEFEFSHRMLPCIRLPDISLVGEMHAVSFLSMISGLLAGYANLTNMIFRNQVFAAHPKWMVPAGAAKVDSLGNDMTIVQYKGAVPPQLVSSNPTPKEVFEFREMIKQEFQQLSGVYGASRGEPPPGIKAGIALQFLDEQEQERANEDVLNFSEAVRSLAQMTLAVAGDKYDPSDKRFVRVVGKNNQWMKVFFDTTYLSKDYDIRIQGSSALPNSKAARTQTLIDLAQTFPDQVSGEQVLDLLDMAQNEKFVDIATVSVKTAEAETEILMQGDDVAEPKEYENHIQHWKVHVRQLQEFSFKNMTPEDVQEKLKDHIMAHEMLMYEKGMKNPLFAKELSMLDLFPIFMTPPSPEVMNPEQVQVQPSVQATPEGLAQEQGLPVNPDQGGEPQLAVAPEVPGVQDQLEQEPMLPADPGPVQPTGAV